MTDPRRELAVEVGGLGKWGSEGLRSSTSRKLTIDEAGEEGMEGRSVVEEEPARMEVELELASPDVLTASGLVVEAVVCDLYLPAIPPKWGLLAAETLSRNLPVGAPAVGRRLPSLRLFLSGMCGALPRRGCTATIIAGSLKEWVGDDPRRPSTMAELA